MLKKLALSAAIYTAVGLSLATQPLIADDGLLTKSWDAIQQQAKQEGSLNWYVWFNQKGFREIIKEFEQEKGITVNLPESSDDKAIVNKLLAEINRDEGDIDVIAMGGDQSNTLDLAASFLGPILPIMPESDSLITKINGGDGKGYAVAFWGNQTGMAYDSRRVKFEDLPNTVEELSAWLAANPENFGFNYEKGGSGPSFALNIARNLLEITPESEYTTLPDMTKVWDWFNSREDQFVITASNADSLTRLNDGEFTLVPGWEDHLSSLQREKTVGEHVKFYVPQWGMNGGGNIVAIPKNSTKKAAALVFVSWLTSAKTQTKFNELFGTAPTNKKADDSKALVSMNQRQNSRDWTGPLPIGDFVGPFIENVIQD